MLRLTVTLNQGVMFKKLIQTLLLFCFTSCGFFSGPSDIKVADPPRAVSDARRLIEEERGNRNHTRTMRRPEELPESLRIPGLRYAFVHSDHVDLVIARNPDVDKGARIWSLD